MYYTIRDANAKTVAVTGARSAYGTVVIPEKITTAQSMTYTVVEIGTYAFSRANAAQYLTDVTIPSTVTYIGDYAFADCIRLTAINIPDGVTSIGRSCFSGCSGLKSVTVGTGLNHVSPWAFSKCYPDSVNITDLEAWCKIDFEENSYNAYIPSGHTIDSNPLRGASLYLNGKKVESLAIPETVTEVKDHAFYACKSIKSVSFHKEITSIGSYAFANCANIDNVSANLIVCHISSIGAHAFEDTQWLQNQPEGVVYISKVAYCYKGQPANTIELRQNTVTIADEAFYNSYNVKFIALPPSLRSIGKSAFSGCRDLEGINLDRVNAIGDGAFSSCASLTNIIVGEYSSHVHLGNNAFSNCTSLSKVTLGTGVTSIGSYCFNSCTALTEVVYPESIRYIGDYAFNNTPWLYSLPNGLNYVGLVAFRYCGTMLSQDRDIVIKEGTVQVAGDAFPDYSLRSVVLPSSLEFVGQTSFIDSNSLIKITCYAMTPPQTLQEVNYKPFNNPGFLNAVVYVPRAALEDYQSDPWWQYFKSIKPIIITGDANGDCAVNISDVNTVVEYTISGGYDETCDVNGDGIVNVADINFIINIILKN